MSMLLPSRLTSAIAFSIQKTSAPKLSSYVKTVKTSELEGITEPLRLKPITVVALVESKKPLLSALPPDAPVNVNGPVISN